MDVKLPKLGEGADSGTVVNILVKEGDRVEKGQTILELENEKAVAPIPSSAAGTVASLRVKEGDKISVGHVLLTLEGGNGASGGAAPAAPAAATKEKSGAPKAAPTKSRQAAPEPEAEEDEADGEESEETQDTASTSAPAAAPSIRRMARELGIDLRRVRGTESGGRVGLGDLKAYVQRLIKLAGKGRSTSGSNGADLESIDFSQWGQVAKRPMTSLRKVISRRMVENWNAIPHVTQFDEVDITELNELRKKHAASYDAKGARLTVTTFVLKAVVEALKKHPVFNSSIDELADEVIYKEYYHLGLAVDTEAGLMVPVIRDVDKKDLVQLSKDVTELAGKARERKLGLEEMRGGTFTISNQGGIGGAHFTPIVNKPEVAILGLGRGLMKPIVREGKIEARLMMPICISYDHRVIDGGTAARFTVDLVAAIQGFKEEQVKL